MSTLIREDDIRAVVRDLAGEQASPAAWQVERVGYESGSPATGGLFRVRGTTVDGSAWSVFVKLLQHVRH